MQIAKANHYRLKIYSFFIKWYSSFIGRTSLIRYSINNVDWLTGIPISKISPTFIYCFYEDNSVYTYDLRSAYLLKKNINVYTNVILQDNNMIKKISFLKSLGHDIGIRPDINDSIYMLHELGFDIKRTWFQKVNARLLYLSCYADYSKLSGHIKYCLNIKQELFKYPYNNITNIKKNIHKYDIDAILQLLYHFIADCKNNEFKILGSIFFLQSLVKCSYEAADSFSYLL